MATAAWATCEVTAAAASAKTGFDAAEWLTGKGNKADKEKSVLSRRSARLQKGAKKVEGEAEPPASVLTYNPSLPRLDESDPESDDDESESEEEEGLGGSDDSESEESSSEEEEEEVAAMKQPPAAKKSKKTAKKPPDAANKSLPSIVTTMATTSATTDGVTKVLESQDTQQS